MSSPAAWPPCHQKTKAVKARPMLIHTADSMAASLVDGACGRRWTSSRSTISSAVTKARNATQIQIGTWKLAKFSSLDSDDWAARTLSMVGGYLRLRTAGGCEDSEPKVSPATGAVVTAPDGRADDDAHQGLLPFDVRHPSVYLLMAQTRARTSWPG